MKNRLYMQDFSCYQDATEIQLQRITKNFYYDLDQIPSKSMQKEIKAFVKYRAEQVNITTIFKERQIFNKICRFLQKYGQNVESLRDKEQDVWIRQLKAWMLQEGIPLTERTPQLYGQVTQITAREIAYMGRMLKFLLPEDDRSEQEKDIWKLDKLEIQYHKNLIKNYKTINFTQIYQQGIKDEVKKGIYVNLQYEAIASVQKELTAMRRLSRYLKERYPDVNSCKDIRVEMIEEYIIYLNTEKTGLKNCHADLCRLRSILLSVGKVCNYRNLEGLISTRDIPSVRKTNFKTYSDGELKRLNAALVEMDEQTARLMIIHQMLGTRISDTLTLKTDCLYELRGMPMIRIEQMKSRVYEKPISEEVAALICRAVSYTKEHYGNTQYIFVDDKSPDKPMQYTTVSSRVVGMIYKKELKDDNGNYFGFGSHLYRHFYGAKLADMHLDDWTIARLLGHTSVRNVKYYRKLSNKMLADDSRKAREKISEMILRNLDGWEEEYEQIRQDDSLK